MLGSSEDNTALSRALSQLAEVEEKIEQLQQEQANSDFFLLAEVLSDYIRLLAAVRVRAPGASLKAGEDQRVPAELLGYGGGRGLRWWSIILVGVSEGECSSELK